ELSKSASDLRTELELERAAREQAVASAEELRRLNETLTEAVRSRDAVLSVVAHDLRNPLNVISLAANSLLQRLPSSAARLPVDRIVRSANRAQRMVRGLLAVSALETGQFVIETKGVEPSALLMSALESQQGVAAEASVILSSDLSPNLPHIEGDEERLLE